jgi:hypothetical protein
MKQWKSQSWTRRLRSLPGPLTMTAIIFGIVPLWSLVFMHRPWELFQVADHWKGAVVIFNFWIAPFAFALCALTRHKFLIPLFIIESCTMLLHSMFGLTVNSPELMSLQVLLIVAMLLFTLFLVRTDALYSLMQGSSRPWRSRPRHHIGLSALLFSTEKPERIKVVVQDGSLNGMQISGPLASLKAFFPDKQKQDQMEFFLKIEDKVFEFSSSIAWTREEDGEEFIGLRIADKDTMEAFFEALPAKHDEDLANPFLRKLDLYWQKKPFRQAAVSIWTIIILAGVLTPIAGKHLALKKNSSQFSDATYMKAGFGPLFLRGR